jgi:hypothetical protein
MSKHASLKLKALFLRGVCKVVIKMSLKAGSSSSIELDVAKNWVQFWRWQKKVIEMKWQERN